MDSLSPSFFHFFYFNLYDGDPLVISKDVLIRVGEKQKQEQRAQTYYPSWAQIDSIWLLAAGTK